MLPNTSPQLQKLFQACLGFARQLSSSPGLFCKLEVKLEENSFNFQTMAVLEKVKVLATIQERPEKKNPPCKVDAYSW